MDGEKVRTGVDVARALHARIQQSVALDCVIKSVLNGRVTSHTVSSAVAFSNLVAFQNVAKREKCEDRSFIGSINGELVFSVNVGYSKPVKCGGRKRKADTAADEADRALDRIKKSGLDAEGVSDSSYAVAKETICDMLRLEGASGEPVLESWAVSLRTPGQYGASPSTASRPSLVIAMRLAGGIAIPLSIIHSVVTHCKDGMITISDDSVNRDFDLPMTEQCREAHDRGQKSLLLLASVPHVEPQPTAPD